MKITLPPSRDRIAKRHAKKHGIYSNDQKLSLFEKIMDPSVKDIPEECRRQDEIMSKSIAEEKEDSSGSDDKNNDKDQ